MSITDEGIKHIAKLSRLTVSEEETIEFAKDLSKILDYVETLNKVDTTGIEPTASIAGSAPVFREDKVANSFGVDFLLENAPEVENNYFLVPKVIE